MIDPGAPKEPETYPGVELEGKLKALSTSEVDWGTKVAYDITIRTFNPAALGLATLKAGTKLKVKVTLTDEPEPANTSRKRK